MKRALSCLVLIALAVGCAGCSQSAVSSWLSPDLLEVSMNKQPLESMLQAVKREEIKSIYVLKDGKPVLEYYSGQDRLFGIYSCTKSIMSACLGIALEQGAIESIDQPISDFFPELLEEGVDPQKRNITIRHLLNMTSGIDWPEWTEWNYGTAPMRQSPNWVEFVLARPMAYTPGQVFNYSSGGSHLLGVIIQKQTGKKLLDFAHEYLFGPLGITDVEWYSDPQGFSYGGAGIVMSTCDMAKIGQLYLNQGKWEDKQIVPEDWVCESTTWQSRGERYIGSGYGYQWWLTSLDRSSSSASSNTDIFFAMGYGGQLIYVIPELELVVAFTSWLPNNPLRAEHFLRTYIIPAVQR